MKIKNLLIIAISLTCFFLPANLQAQVPVAAFSISPNPVCSGTANVVQVTDLSSNSPTSWSYTFAAQFGPPVFSTVQNPAISFNIPGTYTVALVATNASGSSTRVSHTLQVLQSPNGQINPANVSTCAGGAPITLNAMSGGANTFSWSTGATTNSVSVSPAVTTIYSCVITSANGCFVSRSATITISQPTVTINSNPANICPGSSVTMVSNSSGPGPFTYSWSTAATTKSISTNVPGTYTVEVTDANGCTGIQTYSLGTSNTLSLTATANPSVICIGSTVTIRVNGAATYTWSTGANNPNIVVGPTTTTTYSVSGTSGACSGSTSLVLTVNVNPTITIASSASAICSGNSANLTASGAASFTWNPGGGITPGITVSPGVSTTYTVRGINLGCPAKTGTVLLTVLPSPTVSISSSSLLICAGEIVAIAANGAQSYTWSTGATNAILILSPGVTTTYSVTGTALNNCTGTSFITQNVSDCTGFGNPKADVFSFDIFPNPNNGNFTISTESGVNISISNELGQIIKFIPQNETNTSGVSISELPGGVYFISMQNQNGVIKQKVIVMRN